MDGELTVQIAVNGLQSQRSPSSSRLARAGHWSWVAGRTLGALLRCSGSVASVRRLTAQKTAPPVLAGEARPIWSGQGDAWPVGRRARPPDRTTSLPSLPSACLPAAEGRRCVSRTLGARLRCSGSAVSVRWLTTQETAPPLLAGEARPIWSGRRVREPSRRGKPMPAGRQTCAASGSHHVPAFTGTRLPPRRVASSGRWIKG